MLRQTDEEVDAQGNRSVVEYRRRVLVRIVCCS